MSNPVAIKLVAVLVVAGTFLAVGCSNSNSPSQTKKDTPIAIADTTSKSDAKLAQPVDGDKGLADKKNEDPATKPHCIVETQNSNQELKLVLMGVQAFELDFFVIENLEHQLIITPVTSAETMNSIATRAVYEPVLKRAPPEFLKNNLPQSWLEAYGNNLLKAYGKRVLEGALKASVVNPYSENLSGNSQVHLVLSDYMDHDVRSSATPLNEQWTTWGSNQLMMTKVPYLKLDNTWGTAKLWLSCFLGPKRR